LQIRSPRRIAALRAAPPHHRPTDRKTPQDFVMNWLYAIVVLLAATLAVLFWRSFAQEAVFGHQRGLLYRNGRLQKEVGPARHRFLKAFGRLDIYDVRRQPLILAGQEILTRDNISARVSLVGALSLEELLTKRGDLDAGLLADVAEKAKALGFELPALAIRDVMLPANLKRALAGVLEAKKHAERNLEKARGEQAVLRSLANSSKIYDGYPALLQARRIEAMAQGKNSIIFGGEGVSLAPQKG
jgi:regulator of protease activity HflC (stomatin/prohibitin superfamily)